MNSLLTGNVDEAVSIAPALWVNLAQVWRNLLIASLPLNQVVALPLSGINVNLSDGLLPLLVLFGALLLTGGRFPVRKYQVVAGGVLVLLVASFLVVTIWAQGVPPLVPLKIALGYLFTFATYLLFSRATAEQAKRFLALLAWVGGLVAVVSIAAGALDNEGRLNSILWGRTNAFGAALLMPIAAGCISLFLYKNLSVLPATVISVLALALTQSRGSLLVLVVIITALLVVRSRRPLRAVAGLAVAGLLLLVIVVANREAFRSIAVVDRLTDEYVAISDYLTTHSDYDKRQVMSGRLFLWESALAQIRHSPWSGNPVRAIYIPQWAGSETVLLEGTEITYHSWVLGVAAGYGLVVLGLNVVLLLIALSPYVRRGALPQRMVRIVLLGLIAYGLAEPMFEGGFFNLNTVSMLFWVLAGIGTQLPEPALRESRKRHGHASRAVLAT